MPSQCAEPAAYTRRRPYALAAKPDRAALHDALCSPNLRTVAALADRFGVTTRQIERLCTAHFGRPPKRILNEQRLLRTVLTLRTDPEAPVGTVIDLGYFDYPHFSRECRQILGDSPKVALRPERIPAVVSRLALP